jgi:nucleoside-diphosphate-sugar epimerase
VLISTDKALNAQAVYGQSKALCEWIVEAYGARDDVSTAFVAVRFGNVLDSSGSVIRIFKRRSRRAAGDGDEPGDDALLHDDPRGGVARHPGRLDRRARRDLRPRHGEPVKILDLAQSMIRLSGKEPEREIPIEFIGRARGRSMLRRSCGAKDRSSGDPGNRRSTCAGGLPGRTACGLRGGLARSRRSSTVEQRSRQ